MRPRTAAPASIDGKPIALGMGLVALDVVVTADKTARPRYFAGGTCGNVMTCLSYLGWASSPISRLASGPATDRVVQDLKQWSVSTRFITQEADGSTPIIIEKIGRSSGGLPRHSFSWRCPACGAHLPGYRPVLASAVHDIALRIAKTEVFFFDRVSRGVLFMAAACRKRGAVVVFEPSGVGDPSLFQEAWSLAHIVKYSHERLRDIADVGLSRREHGSVLLEIETLGSEGLRYRSRLPHAKADGWNKLEAFPIEQLRDTAGAGDWCTAGLLSKVAREGAVGLKKISAAKLRDAVRYGQALAAWNCRYEGARGGMYEVERSSFGKAIARILEGADQKSRIQEAEAWADGDIVFCPSCIDTTALESRTSAAKRA